MNKILSKIKIKKRREGRLPSKRSMNLYIKVKDGNSWQVVLPLAVFLIVVVFAIYKLGVVNRLEKLNSLRHENALLEQQLAAYNNKLEGYEQLEEEYRRYTTGYLAPDEQGLLSRERIFEMLAESAEGIGKIKSISIESNQVGMNVDIASLEDIDIIQDRLKEMDNIDEISISTAKGTNNVDVEGYIMFTVKADGDAQPAADMSDTEKTEKYSVYSQAAEAARNAAKDAIINAGSAAISSALQEISQSAASQGSAASGRPSSAGSAAQQGSHAGGTAAAEQQKIGSDDVVVMPEGLTPFGFDSIEDGMKQLQEAGQ